MDDFLKKEYKLNNDIFTFKIEDSSTNKVTNFYKESPFPNYKDTDNKSTILEKGDKNTLAAQFKKFIGYKKKCFRSWMWYRPIIYILFDRNK